MNSKTPVHGGSHQEETAVDTNNFSLSMEISIPGESGNVREISQKPSGETTLLEIDNPILFENQKITGESNTSKITQGTTVLNQKTAVTFDPEINLKLPKIAENISDILQSNREENLDDIEALVKSGEELYNSNQYEQAEPVYRKLTDLQPDDAHVWKRLWFCLYKQGKYNGEALSEEALVIISKAIKLNPENADNWNSGAFLLYKLGRYEESLNFLEKAVKFGLENELYQRNFERIKNRVQEEKQTPDFKEAGERIKACEKGNKKPHTKQGQTPKIAA